MRQEEGSGAWCRAYDLPFQRHMGLPYSDFVLNIQPDDYQQLNDKIQFFLDNPARLRRMQVLRNCFALMSVLSRSRYTQRGLACCYIQQKGAPVQLRRHPNGRAPAIGHCMRGVCSAQLSIHSAQFVTGLGKAQPKAKGMHAPSLAASPWGLAHMPCNESCSPQ